MLYQLLPIRRNSNIDYESTIYCMFNTFLLNVTSIQKSHKIPTSPWGFITDRISIQYSYPSEYPRQLSQNIGVKYPRGRWTPRAVRNSNEIQNYCQIEIQNRVMRMSWTNLCILSDTDSADDSRMVATGQIWLDECSSTNRLASSVVFLHRLLLIHRRKSHCYTLHTILSV